MGSAAAPDDGGEALVGQTSSSGVRLSDCLAAGTQPTFMRAYRTTRDFHSSCEKIYLRQALVIPPLASTRRWAEHRPLPRAHAPRVNVALCISAPGQTNRSISRYQTRAAIRLAPGFQPPAQAPATRAPCRG
ncbi:hypothetical protein D1Y85_08720 [Paraburkholderia dinghuensis]|uniref:Uncharacterized protein n=1 Tax=Paraburkholderia dinghuensis TaxID=2305225 RepID=A0A3N6MUU3_9BURK|nr:hypothetical protein D1Y85_08720 [Paraburkholderia dinghuensis]